MRGLIPPSPGRNRVNISAVGSVTTVKRGMVRLVGRKNCFVLGAFSVAHSEEYIL